jgi:hypothetical protein
MIKKMRFSVAYFYQFFKCLPSAIAGYFVRNSLPPPRNKHVILMEAFWEHPASNLIMLFMAKNIQYTSGLDIVQINRDMKIPHLLKNKHAYSIKPVFVAAYSIKVLIDFLCQCLNLLPLIWKNQKIFVDRRDITDYVYDDFLAGSKHPTHKGYGLIYYIFSCSRILFYYAIKRSIRGVSIDYLILTHVVYARYLLLAIAVEELNPGVRKLTYRGANSISFCTLKSNSGKYEAFLFKEEYLTTILERYSESDINEIFDTTMSKGFEGASKDDTFSRSGNSVNSVDEFYNEFDVKLGKKNIFIYAHAFLDGVKYPSWQIYNDNYTWLKETIKILGVIGKNYNIYLKGHPSSDLYSCDVSPADLLEELRDGLSEKIILLNKEVNSNVVYQIADVIITSHGSIGYEAPCYGVPVVTCSQTEYQASNLVKTCHSIEEYELVLGSLGDICKLSNEQILRAKAIYLWSKVFTRFNIKDLPILDLHNPIDIKIEYKKVSNFLKTPVSADRNLVLSLETVLAEDYGTSLNQDLKEISII